VETAKGSLQPAGISSTRNRKVSRLRSFFQFCRLRRWMEDNPAEFITPSQEQEPEAEYFQANEFRKLLDACYVSHTWERRRDYEHRADRLCAFLLFARWTGLAMIDVVRFRRDGVIEGRERGVACDALPAEELQSGVRGYS